MGGCLDLPADSMGIIMRWGIHLKSMGTGRAIVNGSLCRSLRRSCIKHIPWIQASLKGSLLFIEVLQLPVCLSLPLNTLSHVSPPCPNTIFWTPFTCKAIIRDCLEVAMGYFCILPFASHYNSLSNKQSVYVPSPFLCFSLYSKLKGETLHSHVYRLGQYFTTLSKLKILRQIAEVTFFFYDR